MRGISSTRSRVARMMTAVVLSASWLQVRCDGHESTPRVSHGSTGDGFCMRGAPYPPSEEILGIEWDFEHLLRLAPGSDLWPVTWAADGNVYASWGDGGGFGGTNSKGRVSLGFARLEGGPSRLEARNVWGGFRAENPARFPGKCPGILAVDGGLYAWINTQDATPPRYRLAWSSDLGASWELSAWSYPDPTDPDFLPSTFVNFNRDYADARDEFVYAYGARWTGTGAPENDLYLARVPRDRIRERGAWEFLSGFTDAKVPRWSHDVRRRRPVFHDPNGVANTGLAHVVHVAPLRRYLLTVAHRPPGESVRAGVGQLGVFDAPEPWGPWTTVAYYDAWGGFGRDEFLGLDFATKWTSDDGRTLWGVFSSLGVLDSFNLVRAKLLTASRQPSGALP